MKNLNHPSTISNNRPLEVRAVLDQLDRNKILEIYFSRTEGFLPEVISGDLALAYELTLEEIKEYLLNQQPIDPIMHHIFKMAH